MKANRTYKGYQIKDWSGPYGSNPDRGEPKYFIQTQHQTGIDNSSELCPQAWSLREAKEIINRMTDAAKNGNWEVTNACTGMIVQDAQDTLNGFETLREAQEWADKHTNPSDHVVLCDGENFWN